MPGCGCTPRGHASSFSFSLMMMMACPVPQLRVALGHLQCVFVDELLWDLSAPRSACEAYATTVCADLRLGWLACGIIQRRLKDAVDEEAKVCAALRHVGRLAGWLTGWQAAAAPPLEGFEGAGG